MNKDAIFQGILISVLGGIVISSIVGVSALLFNELHSSNKQLSLAIQRLNKFAEISSKMDERFNNNEKIIESNGELSSKAINLTTDLKRRSDIYEAQLTTIKSLVQSRVSEQDLPTSQDSELTARLEQLSTELEQLQQSMDNSGPTITELQARRQAELNQLAAQQQALRALLEQQQIQQQVQQQQ